MNDLTTTGAADNAVESSQLITLKPETYVAQVFNPFKSQLKKAIKAASTVTYDITTTAGMALAKEHRAVFRELRLSAEKTRKERKAPILEIGKLLDTRYKELEGEITPHEKRFDDDIKAEDRRKEEEKQRAIEAERVRVEAIENRIKAIRDVPLQNMKASSAQLQELSVYWSDRQLDPHDFEEYLEDAIAAVNATIVELGKLRNDAIAREQEAARIERERNELAKMKADQEQREREAAARIEAERKAHADREAAMQQERDAMAATMADMQRQMAEMAAKLNPPAIEDHGILVPADPVPAIEDHGTLVLCPLEEARSGSDVVDMEFIEVPFPSFEEIIGVLMRHYEAPRHTVIAWLNTLEFQTFILEHAA
jgi:hypothetical protein